MEMRYAGAGLLTGTVLAFAAAVGPASAAVPHAVQPGETLWSVAAASNLTTRTVAAFNGLPEDAHVVAGQTIQVPTVAEGAAALAAAGVTPAATSASPAEQSSSTAAAPPAEPIPPAPGMGHIDSPWGQLHLDPAAANAWNAMVGAAAQSFGIQLHPGGTLSAHRTYEQQAALYQQYLAGTGAPANPPGTSTHEVGLSVDVATPEMRNVIDQIGAQYGWRATIPSEWWHVSYAGG